MRQDHQVAMHARLDAVRQAFEYLTALLRNAAELARDLGRWMPWSYKAALSAKPPLKGP